MTCSTATRKYIWTVENRANIVLVTVNFVDSVYRKWIKGEDFNMIQEIRKGLAKPFEGLLISITNIDMEEKRERMKELIEANGGRFNKNLTKQTTHLISPTGGGRKVEGALRWKQFLVDPLWLEDCLKRQARVKEKYYSLSLPRSQRGKGAFSEVPDPDRSLLPPNYYSTSSNVALQRTIVTRNKKSSDGLWASVIESLPKSRPKSVTPLASEWENVEQDEPEIVQEVESRNKRKNEESENLVNLKRKRQETLTMSNYDKPREMFEDLVFAFGGFNDKQTRQLSQIVRSHNGKCSTDLHNPDVTHVIINSTVSPEEKATLTKYISRTVTICTEWMIERSLFEKRLVGDVWGRYVEHRKLPEFEGLKVSISGFSGVELLHVGKLIPMLGASLQPTLTPQRHVLVATPKSKKFSYALQWKIPIVGVEWLWECARTGTSVPLASKWTLDNVDRDGQVLRGPTEPSTRSVLSPVTESKMASMSPEVHNPVELLANKIANSRAATTTEQEQRQGSSTPTSFDRTVTRNQSRAQSTLDVPGTQITFCDKDTLREREALLHAMGSTSSEIGLSQDMQFSQETQPAEDAFHHRKLRHQR